MSEKRKKYDVASPEAKALMDEIVHGTFLREGTMVAFPTCFPGATVQIAADESHITALNIADNGVVYGGTSGRQAHLFVGMFHGVTGMVLDLGVISGADRCVAVGCGQSKFAACVNGPGGGRVIVSTMLGLPFDLIQEWGFQRPVFRDLGKVADGEKIVDAVMDDSRSKLIGMTTGHLFQVDLEAERIDALGEVPGAGRLCLSNRGSVLGLDEPDHLWRYDGQTSRLERRAVRLPAGQWSGKDLRWACDPHRGLSYTADSTGRLFAFKDPQGFGECLGQTPLAPVGPMAVTLDGRLFGFCGDQLARLFCYDPANRQVRDLGVAVSVIERRRYGYCFGAAVTGRDGQIFFGEDDAHGHLWIYFPRLGGS